MDVYRIETAAKRIKELSAALAWMRENGEQAINPRDASSFGVGFHLNSCSALPGAKEAANQLSAIARARGAEILALAISDAEKSIEVYRKQIWDETSTP